jgi:hypothetical protein
MDAIDRLRLGIAKSHGLPDEAASRIEGETLEEMEANAKALEITQETHLNVGELGAFQVNTEKYERGAALLAALHGSTDRSLEAPRVTNRPSQPRSRTTRCATTTS